MTDRDRDESKTNRGGITRRSFEKGMLGSAVTLAAALGLPGSSGARPGVGPPRDRGRREVRDLHFDLGHAPAEDLHRHRLHVLGKRIPLRPHTPRSLDRAIERQPELARIPRDRITHFAPNVSLSSVAAHRLFVSTRSKTRGAGILLVGFHIPRAARERAGLLEALDEPVRLHRGIEIVLEDAGGSYYGSDFPTAMATVQHHPEIATNDADVAAQIQPYLQNSASIVDLAASITEQGPAYELLDFDGQECIPDEQAQGWAACLPVSDVNGNDNHDMVYSCTSESILEGAIREVQQQIIDDPSLQGVLYDFQYHGDDPNDDAAAPETLGSGSPGLTASITGYHHNLGWSNFSVDSSDGKDFSFLLFNVNLLWYGVYVTWLDFDGNAMSSPDRAPDDTLVGLLRNENTVLMNGIDMETDERKWVQLLEAPAELFGIPAGGLIPTKIELTFPDGAASAKIEVMGLGAHGDPKHAWSIFPGAAVSAVADFMVPLYFLTKDVGESESASLNTLIKDHPQSVQLPMVLSAIALLEAEGNADTQSDLVLAGSLASVFKGIVNAWVLAGSAAFDSDLFKDWLNGELTAQEIADSVPFIGWGLRALQVAGTLAALAESTAEIITNPLVITNVITETHTLRVTVRSDPDDFEFPSTWAETQLVVSSGEKKICQEFSRDDVVISQDGSNQVFTYEAKGIPSSGTDATAEIVMLSASGWAAGQGSVTFLNSRDATVDLEITIEENAVPIESDTVYTHNRVLAFDGSAYAWNDTSQIPAPFPDLVATGNGISAPGNSTLWVPGGVMGYSWRGNSDGITDCETGQAPTSSVYRFQTVNLTPNTKTPNDTLKRIDCGYDRPMPVAFNRRRRADDPDAVSDDHFFLIPVSDVTDPTDPSVLPAEFHASPLVLDSNTPPDPRETMSYGRFRISPIDRLEYYDSGDARYLFGLSTTHNKIGRLRLSEEPVPMSEVTSNASLMIGTGQNDARLVNACAMAISKDGAILVLENTPRAGRIKAFDTDGKPWRLFDLGDGPTSAMPLQTEVKSVVYQDIAMADSKLIWVLSYEVSGATSIPTDPKAYRLDVYDYAGNRILRQTDVPVARISVDTFHNLYTLNYQYVLSPSGQPVARTEPSVSDWLPTPPSTP